MIAEALERIWYVSMWATIRSPGKPGVQKVAEFLISLVSRLGTAGCGTLTANLPLPWSYCYILITTTC